MATTVKIQIKNRVAACVENKILTAMNTGDNILFEFDDEWNPKSSTASRTARFISDGVYIDIPFNGNICPLPSFSKYGNIFIGVFWGDIKTTSSAMITYVPSAASENDFPVDPPNEVYNRILEALNQKVNKKQLSEEIEKAFKETDLIEKAQQYLTLKPDISKYHLISGAAVGINCNDFSDFPLGYYATIAFYNPYSPSILESFRIETEILNDMSDEGLLLSELKIGCGTKGTIIFLYKCDEGGKFRWSLSTSEKHISKEQIDNSVNEYFIENPVNDGYTPIKGEDYWTNEDKEEIIENAVSEVKRDIPKITQDAGESESLVMSQKAVTDLVNNALGANDTQYETVDTVTDMTDTDKSYVLSSTGTVWAYGETEVDDTQRNLFNIDEIALNQNPDGTTRNGAFTTDYIPLTIGYSDPYNIRVIGLDVSNSGLLPDLYKVAYYDSNKTELAIVYATVMSKTKNADKDYNLTIGYDADSNGNKQAHYDSIAYVRLLCRVSSSAITQANVPALTVTTPEPKTKTEYAWYDTKLKPESGNSNGNYVDLLVKVNQNKTDISEISSRVTSLENGNDSLTIPSFWQDAVEECISKIKALQVGKNCITFPFFSDNHTRNGYVGMLIAHIMTECHIPYCFFGGDNINSGYIKDEAAMIAQEKAFRETMSYIPKGRFCRTLGNHDGFWNVTDEMGDEYFYNRNQCYELFLREDSVSNNKHYGIDGTYYYADDLASKTRFILLNTNENDGNGGACLDEVQFDWLKNIALSFSESGWAVVFFSHQPITNNWGSYISNAQEVQAWLSDYINGSSENKADVAGWFSGHIHRDRIYQTDHTNKTSADDQASVTLPWKTVTITSDHTGIAYDDATKHTVANDDQSHAIDFVTINKNTRTVNLTRLGIGNDRSYGY